MLSLCAEIFRALREVDVRTIVVEFLGLGIAQRLFIYRGQPHQLERSTPGADGPEKVGRCPLR